MKDLCKLFEGWDVKRIDVTRKREDGRWETVRVADWMDEVYFEHYISATPGTDSEIETKFYKPKTAIKYIARRLEK